MSLNTLPLDTVIPGDCLEILHDIPDKSVDLVFADPPYNLQLRQELWRPNQSLVDAVDDEWDQFETAAAYAAFTRAWLTECRRVLKDTGTLWVIGSYHNIYRVGAELGDLGFWILNDVIWQKANPMPNFRGMRFTNATETLIWALKSPKQKYTFNYHAMKHLNGDKQMTNVWRIPLCMGYERIRVDGKKVHSTQKPESLLYRVILASTNPGDVILDPFFGTGTTGAVARKLKRHFIGIEREPEYVTIAQQRITAIKPTDDDPNLFTTPSRRKVPRVAFGKLVELQYILPGETLYTQDRRFVATVKADAHLVCGTFTGSIHKVACDILGHKGANGWDFWYIQNGDGALISIDVLRQRYRAEVLGIT